jgi:hypothetical protein
MHAREQRIWLHDPLVTEQPQMSSCDRVELKPTLHTVTLSPVFVTNHATIGLRPRRLGPSDPRLLASL